MKQFLKGNDALSEAAIIAGCRHYFGYPITPQNEITAYMAKRMPEVGGVFVQAESETAAINMVFGAAATGVRVMTTTSSPGFSLMQEGMSYLAAGHLPCVVANIMRGGPGLGNIAGAQGDYFQAVKGGGHGDYKLIVLTPAYVQEMIDFTILGFDLADKYLIPVLILVDGIVGQMVEPAEFPQNYTPKTYEKPWALTGAKGRPKNVIRTLWLDDNGVELNNIKLQQKYSKIKSEFVMYEEYMIEDAEVILVAYGTPARICKAITKKMRKEGYKIGTFRIQSAFPFPEYRLMELALQKHLKGFLVVEMSAGQMVEDVRLSVKDYKPVNFYGRMGGMLPEEKRIAENIFELLTSKV
ncbi:MAG: 3-methyl-2-oxobutanoate dehydrogenase subunit VorB [Brevinematales bacterium]|nr:3-methyl-2-oxobutanoate dehydrogenase subunit VorB [Brevinematales bacterium]